MVGLSLSDKCKGFDVSTSFLRAVVSVTRSHCAFWNFLAKWSEGVWRHADGPKCRHSLVASGLCSHLKYLTETEAHNPAQRLKIGRLVVERRGVLIVKDLRATV